MRYQKVFLAIVLLLCSSSLSLAVLLNAPHDSSHNVTCATCHASMLPETDRSLICTTCHDGSDPEIPWVITHSNELIYAEPGWETQCLDCHDPHFQEQLAYKTTDFNDLFIIRGVIVNVAVDDVAGITTVDYAADFVKPEWDLAIPGMDWGGKSSPGRGLIFVVDRNNPNHTFEIISATTTQLVLEGAMDQALEDAINALINGSANDREFGIIYGMFIRPEVQTPSRGIQTVKFFDPYGGYVDTSGAATPDGLCQVCHTLTDHWSPAAPQNDVHFPTRDCIDCHEHTKSFAHGNGGGSADCETCHGHDTGNEYDPGLFSQGSGTFQSHSTHTENDIDDLRGPNIPCNSCHDITNYPYFLSGVDADGDGSFSLAETDVCSSCHSASGTYDGVNDTNIGAKSIWKTGAYASTNSATLTTGKEKWCAGCHDESPSIVNAISAPNVVGDESGAYTYGTGWGYYKTGHGLDSASTYPASGGLSNGGGISCDGCHDYSLSHVDGDARTYAVASDNYQEGYRLKLVNGQDPMRVPRLSGSTGFNPNEFRLCFRCHDPNKILVPYVPFIITTNFRVEGEYPRNYHQSHLYPNGDMFDSDWSSILERDSKVTCIACHNVHGSTRNTMVRDGKLVNREPGLITYYSKEGTTDVPGFVEVTLDYDEPFQTQDGTILASVVVKVRTEGEIFETLAPTLHYDIEQVLIDGPVEITLRDRISSPWPPTGPPYDIQISYSTNPITPPTNPVTLAESDAMLFYRSSTVNICYSCHNGGDYYSKFYRVMPGPQQAPNLAWTGEANYSTDGVDPDGGVNNGAFGFRVSFSDANFEFPSSMEVWVDENDNATYEASEKYTMKPVDFSDTDSSDGKLYYRSMNIVYAGDGTLNYRFYASDGIDLATGTPTSDKTITISNNAPALGWIGSGNYVSDGVNPDSGDGNMSFEFQINYTDVDNDPPAIIQLWIDKNDDNDYLDADEKIAITELDSLDTVFTDGKIYSTVISLINVGDGILNYRFYASDGGLDATGVPATTDKTVVVSNTAPFLSWTGDTGYTTDGVNPDSVVSTGNFEFRVTYTDVDNDASTSIQVWIDKDDNGDYLGVGEKIDMSAIDAGDTIYADGKQYTYTTSLSTIGDGSLHYRFSASDGTDNAIGSPTTDSTVIVYASNNVPDLDWTGETEYTADGVDPDIGKDGADFTFHVKYTDIDNTAPTSVQLWVDKNDDGDYLGAGEKVDMFPVDGDSIYTDGKFYTVTTIVPFVADGGVSYLFSAHDGTDAATGNAATAQTLTVVTPITVCGSGCDFTTIQAAIDDIGTVNGDYVVVSDGTYNENITFSGKDITVQSINGASSTTIQGTGADAAVVTFNSGETTNAVLDGFTIDNQAAGGNSMGISIVASEATITNSVIQGSTGTGLGGVGIYVDDYSGMAGAIITDSRIGGTSLTNGNIWSGVYFDGTGTLLISNCEITYNQACGLNIDSSGPVTVTNTIISNNIATIYGGGGIFSRSSNLSITNSQIEYNETIGSGGGLYLTGNGALITINSTSISNNTASGGENHGGGIQMYGNTTPNTLSISNSTISNNFASFYGGGLNVESRATPVVTIANTDITNNTSTHRGGGIAIAESLLTMSDSNISGNTVNGVLSAPGGGGVLVGGTAIITNTSIDNNMAPRGGGITIYGGNLTLTGSTVNSNETTASGGMGGGIYKYASGSTMTLSKCLIQGNSADSGGGVMVYSSSVDGDAIIDNCVISGNIAGNGGGIYFGNDSPMKIYNSTISGNYASSRGGGYYLGGAYIEGGGFYVNNSIVWGNDAGEVAYSGIYTYDAFVYVHSINNSNVQSIQNTTMAYDGWDNIDADPKFVDLQQAAADNPTTAGDFHLTTESPCIDTASAFFAPVDDIDGDARPIDVFGKGDGVDDYDMGSDEFSQ